jgi:uncharacterized protein involved in response to NO
MRPRGGLRLKPGTAPPPEDAWRWRRLMEAPHRLAFFLAAFVLGCASLWWSAALCDRSLGLGFRHALPPLAVQAAVTTFGFMTLFFAGFLFTAGPRWLNVAGPSARQLLPALSAQACGWSLWLAGSHFQGAVSVAGAAMAACGLLAIALRFACLVRSSRQVDRLHAKAVAAALFVGSLSLAALGAAVAAGRPDLALASVHTGLWGGVLAVFVAVAHRMLPFFSAAGLQAARAGRPTAVLALMLFASAFEASAPWIDRWAGPAASWWGVRALVEGAVAAVLLSLALSWWRMQRRRDRLFLMLHAGFTWLGVGLALLAAAHCARAAGIRVLPQAGLHAITLGCLGSLMLAMVTRVTCGQGGRPVVADTFLWRTFCVLQAAVLLRLVASEAHALQPALLLLAALAWTTAMLGWGGRLAAWWGKPNVPQRSRGGAASCSGVVK